MADGRKFHDTFFAGELNRFVGSGGELVLKRSSSESLDVGDVLIGIGVTHLVESLSRPPGLDSFRAIDVGDGDQAKIAARAFRVAEKTPSKGGFEFRFSPLAPKEYAEALREVSEGAVDVDPGSIPEGTFILSFLDSDPEYSLQGRAGRSRGDLWSAALKGERHWNVGAAEEADFWTASFPSDDLQLLREISPAQGMGTIQFGLSLLPGSAHALELERVPCHGPSGETTYHHFCLDGQAVGTNGLETLFPIGLRTQITFRPTAL